MRRTWISLLGCGLGGWAQIDGGFHSAFHLTARPWKPLETPKPR